MTTTAHRPSRYVGPSPALRAIFADPLDLARRDLAEFVAAHEPLILEALARLAESQEGRQIVLEPVLSDWTGERAPLPADSTQVGDVAARTRSIASGISRRVASAAYVYPDTNGALLP